MSATTDLAALIAAVKAADDIDDYEAWQQADAALRAEMGRRIAAPSAGLLALIREYGDLRADAVAEGEMGSPSEADLIHARAELLLERIGREVEPAPASPPPGGPAPRPTA